MKSNGRRLLCSWMVPVGLAVIAGHAMILAYVASHLVMSAAIASGVLIFIAVKHVGITAVLFRSVHRRER